MAKYVHLVRGRKFLTNAYVISYGYVPESQEVNVAKFLLYLYKKGFVYYHLVDGKQIIVEVRNSRERKRLGPILHYYKLKRYVVGALVSDTKIPMLGDCWELVEVKKGEYKAVKVL